MAKCEFSLLIGKANVTMKSADRRMTVEIIDNRGLPVNTLETTTPAQLRRMARQLEMVADFVENNAE